MRWNQYGNIPQAPLLHEITKEALLWYMRGTWVQALLLFTLHVESLFATNKIQRIFLYHNPKLFLTNYFMNRSYPVFSDRRSPFPNSTVRFRHWSGLSPPHLQLLWIWAPRIHPTPPALPPSPPPLILSLWYVFRFEWEMARVKLIYASNKQCVCTFLDVVSLTRSSPALSPLQITASIWTSGVFQSLKLPLTPLPLRIHHSPTHRPTTSLRVGHPSSLTNQTGEWTFTYRQTLKMGNQCKYSETFTMFNYP